MTYRRVIPRDLFNEANLLKCMGQLYLKLDEFRGHQAKLLFHPEAPDFGVQQDESDGSISCWNVILVVRGREVRLKRPLNSREAWPLYATISEDEEIEVFQDDGYLTNKFLSFISRTD